MRLLLADLILVVHFAFVVFVVAGLPLVWIGAACGWRWVRNRTFRIAHLAAILFVSAEAAAGVWCPLTLWEDALRGTAGERSFVARWIHALLFYDLPPWTFTAAYLLYAALVALTWWRVPPLPRSRP
ncbi:MAG: DUF2784 domain-containing protein [Burkholderiales bacterium]|nr:DUF2784 domain-containing protein [Burkholderiales bacterium]MCW5576598.1 DUF2784 domain-containing protein [Burkholderiales bacterium]MCW5605836.1 DUF2784 domain-containing protein [Burkholderiales bacterium]